MQKSESIKSLAEALVSFQAEVKNPANTADNPFFKSKYAPLHDILSNVRPLAAKHGLAIIQSPSGDGDKIIVTTMMVHKSGEWMEFDPLILRADKATAQGAGSAITYGRRYALSAVLGISSEDDDDGNHATKGAKRQTKAGSAKSTSNRQTKTQSTQKKETASAGNANEADGLKWDGFWKQAGNMGFDEVCVREFASNIFNKPNLQSLKEIITDQRQLNGLLSQLAKKAREDKEKAGAHR